MIYYILSLVLIIALLIYFRVIDIRVSFAKSNDRFLVNIVDNSYLSTLKAFISAEDYEYTRGKVIFFTTWNSHCRGSIEGIPALNQIQLKYHASDNLVFIAYCSDLKANAIPAFLNAMKLKLDYRMLTTNGEGLRSSLRTLLARSPDWPPIDPAIDFLNLSFIIDANEKILYYNLGGMTMKELPAISAILDKV
ncbi:MAG: hypothetical protein JWQ27_1587 [Ferruginibacter sp.]|nr:hypothetical protein [Ferruginibacter sp.]